MKFKEIPYVHLEYGELSEKLVELINNFKNSSNVDEAIESFNKFYDYFDHFKTMFSLAYVRNSLDTTDEFYSKEISHMYDLYPRVQVIFQDMTTSLLNTPFRKELEEKWGKLLFLNEEIELKTMSPEVVEELQQESKLQIEYDKLMASAKIEFDGKELNLSQLRAYLENPNRDVRKRALNAKADWFMHNIEKFDNLFNELTKIRTQISTKLGYKNFIELAYYRRKRNCYDSKMVADFRKGIVEYIVPVTMKLKAAQAERIGVDSIKAYDIDIKYLDGNAKPFGTEEEMLNHTKKMYSELDSDTGEFFSMMLENDLIDVTTRAGKSVGGYCTSLDDYKVPFIFANFNGTSADVGVLTHEAGHAFADYMSRDISPKSLKNYTFDTAEIHSMAMEFLTWNWMDGFFGEQTQKYYESHLESALTFIPYGCMVDEFQHEVYEKSMSEEERNKYWLELEAKYRPWLNLEDTIFYGEGRRWQEQPHIYTAPFYYIDYCLAQVIALYFWAEAQEDHAKAWAKYKRLVGYAGTKTFLELIEECGLPNPFVPENLKIIADAVIKWLDKSK